MVARKVSIAGPSMLELPALGLVVRRAGLPCETIGHRQIQLWAAAGDEGGPGIGRPRYQAHAARHLAMNVAGEPPDDRRPVSGLLPVVGREVEGEEDRHGCSERPGARRNARTTSF